MPKERLNKATRQCILRLAYALRCTPQDFSDLPRPMPEEAPPEKPDVIGRRAPKSPSVRDRSRRLTEVAAAELEEGPGQAPEVPRIALETTPEKAKQMEHFETNETLS